MAKKIAEFCPVCNKETTHREKSVCIKRGKKEGYANVRLPLKCLVCNYKHGSSIKKAENKRHKFVKI